MEVRKTCGNAAYLSHTKLNDAYVVGVVIQFMHDPKKEHLNAVYKILQRVDRGILLKVAMSWQWNLYKCRLRRLIG